MNVFVGLAIGILAAMFGNQSSPDEAAIRAIIQDEVAAWNKGDAAA